MESGSIVMIAILCILIIMSAYFSATETAFSSCNRVRLKNLAAGGDKRAKLALGQAEQFDRLLSTILIGNNIVNISSASLATVLFVRHFGDAGVTISTVVMTVLVLIFGEISPKSMAKEAPERFAMFSAPILRVFLVVLSPVNFLFSQWKRLLSRVFQVGEDQGITEEELITMVEEAQQDGGINQQEGELIRSAIEFNDCLASQIITPRVDVKAVDASWDRERVARVFQESGHSRLPVYQGTLDRITGVVHEKDFYGSQKPVGQLGRPAVFVSPSVPISQLLRTLQREKTHLAVVTDEYGGTLGIVTLEDILEELVGEIWDEHDQVIDRFEQVGLDTYRVLGSADADSLFAFLGLPSQSGGPVTVSGWVVGQLGRIPNEGDRFCSGRLAVTVTKTDYQRVVEITVRLRPAEAVTA